MSTRNIILDSQIEALEYIKKEIDDLIEMYKKMKEVE
jgi:hypothetical protein